MSDDDFHDAATARRFSPVQAVMRAILQGGRKSAEEAWASPVDLQASEEPAEAIPTVALDLTPPAALEAPPERASDPDAASAELSGDAQLAILNAMLDLDREEAGRLELDEAEFDIGVLATLARETFAPAAEARGLALELTFAPGATGIYRGDALRVRQILLTLLSNAVRFTSDGAVCIDVEWDEQRLALSVSDTGVGMSAWRMDRLFTPPKDSGRPGRRRSRGLVTCREAAELMGGVIRVESAPDAGARFTAALPLMRVSGTGDPEIRVSEPYATPAFEAAASATAFGSALRVLVAEPDGVSRLVLTTLLSEIGLDPVVVGDAEAALSAWKQEAWDVILLDVETATVAAPVVARAIRSAEIVARWPRTPILALSAKGVPADMDDHFEAGMDGCIPRPVTAEALHRAIDAAMRLDADAPAEAMHG